MSIEKLFVVVIKSSLKNFKEKIKSSFTQTKLELLDWQEHIFKLKYNY